MAIFTAEHINKSYHRGKKVVLQDISFSAEPGQCVGILGANGCGKSTLLSILAGVTSPDSGQVLPVAQSPFTVAKQKTSFVKM